MMDISLTLSANAGIAMDIGGRRLWVDALHTQKEPGFSTLSPQLQQKMLHCEQFYHPEYICYTHCHPDHYDPALTQMAQQLWPSAKLLLPGEHRLEEDGLQIRYIPLAHEGAQYTDVAHYGIVVSYGGINIFFSGDTAVSDPKLVELLDEIPIHLALMTFPWATLRKGREFLTRHFADTKVILYHLPFAQDDRNGYRASAANVSAHIPDCQMLCDPLQTIQMTF